MRFRELFWAHLMHKEMRFVNAVLLMSILGLVVLAFVYDLGVPLSFYVAGIGFLLFVPIQFAFFYAKADVPLTGVDRGKHYFYYAPWTVHIAQHITFSVAVLAFMLWVRNPFALRILLILVPLSLAFFAWRLFQKMRKRFSK